MISHRVSPVFIGREAELDVLTTAFDEVAGGASATVLLRAEAGGGKSRLVAEFAGRVRSRALVLAGGCVDLGAAGLPYAPFTAALRELVRGRGAAEVAGLLPSRTRGELARMLPELGRVPVDGDPEMARGRLFGLFLALLDQLAERQPVVLVIEDLHWADRSTSDLLAFLVRNLRRGSVLLVATARSDELERVPGLRRLLAELSRMDGVVSVELPRLSRDQVAAQLQGILGRPAEPAVVGAVYERGGGNPLFTEALLDTDGMVSQGMPWSLRELLFSTVKELPGQTQQVLRVAAVGGSRTGHRLLAKVTRLDEAALDAALRPAVTASVVVGEADGYAFRHELFREALREDLLPGERAQAHRVFAEILQADPSLSPDYLPSVQLAAHWRGAGEFEQALRAAWAAAADAGAALAYAEQLQMLEQVLELWDRVPDAALLAGADHAAVAALAAEAAGVSGEPARGLALAEAALNEASSGQQRAALLLLRAQLRREQLLPWQVDDLQAALRLAGEPNRLRGEILVQLFWALVLLGRGQEARQLAADVRALAGRLPHKDFQAEAMIVLAILGSYQGSDVHAALQEALETARRSGSGRAEMRAYLAITDVLERLGQHEQAIQVGWEGYDRAKQLALTRSEGALIAQKLAESLISAGRWDQALEIVAEALERSPAPAWRSLLLLLRWQVAVARGEPDMVALTRQELRSLTASAPAEIQRTLPMKRLEIECLLANGDLSGALAAASAVLSHDTDNDPRYLWPLLATAMRACAEAAATGSPSIASELAGMPAALAQRAARLVTPGPVERAHAAVFTAESSRAIGRPDLGAWDAVAAAWETIGQAYPLAYALLRAADAAAAQGDRDTAATRLPRAAELAARLGTRPLLQQIVRLARRARIDLPAEVGGTEGPAAPFGLTPREMEVLRLVAAGRGNRQIAAELFISPKTASVHVSNIIGKLGVASRVEAAATAHRLQLFDAS